MSDDLSRRLLAEIASMRERGELTSEQNADTNVAIRDAVLAIVDSLDAMDEPPDGVTEIAVEVDGMIATRIDLLASGVAPDIAKIVGLSAQLDATGHASMAAELDSTARHLASLAIFIEATAALVRLRDAFRVRGWT